MGAAQAGGYLGQAKAQQQMIGSLAQGIGGAYSGWNSQGFGDWILKNQGI
jgi:hypothetical protein